MNRACRQRLFESGKQIGPMHRELRGAITLLGGAAHFEPRGFRAGVPGSANPVGRTISRIAHCIAETETVHHFDGVWREVNSCTNTLEARRLLENFDLDTD